MENLKFISLTLSCFFMIASPGFAMGGSADQTAQASPTQSMQEAQKDLNQAAAEFNQAKGSQQQTRQAPLSEVLNPPAPVASNQPQPPQTNPALQGSPETGYAGTWTEPNGDVVTSVIAPRPPQNQSQNYPMIIEPQVSGGNYYPSYDNNGYPGTSAPSQWPTTPDNPGYTTGNGQYIPYPGWMPPYPGQPYPGFNPYPGMNYPPGYWHPNTPYVNQPMYPGPNLPPNFNPSYRPLVPPAQPPANPPANNPGSLMQPGQAPNPMPNLPLAPAGNTWHNSPFAPHPSGGMFGPGPRGRF